MGVGSGGGAVGVTGQEGGELGGVWFGKVGVGRRGGPRVGECGVGGFVFQGAMANVCHLETKHTPRRMLPEHQ